jgi:hypothetical protein
MWRGAEPCSHPAGGAARLATVHEMTWLTWLALAVVVAAVAAVSGIQPKGGRPVARTHMMGMARLCLLVLVIVFAYLAYRARSGG